MKEAIRIYVTVVVAHFLFSGEPSLYTLLHDKAVQTARSGV